uniref:AA_permease domain-containing protein n=1 Tax=Panagrellus redivivus TaxID=6233 RepID=A0A7E4VQV4_PANRE
MASPTNRRSSDHGVATLAPDDRIKIDRRESSASRFQVTKSSSRETAPMLPCPSSEVEGPSCADCSGEGEPMPKVSSAGRFKIFSNLGGKTRADTAPPDAGAAATPPRCVHFDVGEHPEPENDDESVCSGGTHDMDSTLANAKSWRHCATLEHPPIIDFYRNTLNADGIGNTRPSMLELLHGDNADQSNLNEFKEKNSHIVESQMDTMSPIKKTSKAHFEAFKPPPATPRSKFGWIEGVFFRCILNIFGVMLYLRVSWVAGQAGIALGTAVVLLASVVTTITALSTCAICTNGDVKGGGAYFLISRSLGPEFGGSIGLIFSVANAVGAAMYVVGFAETVRDLLAEYGIAILDGGLNDVRIIGLVTCCLLMGIVFIGTGFESKMQMGLLVILTLSILDYFLGTLMPVTEVQALRGVTGYSMATMSDNMLPRFRDGYNFFTVFSIYFPAATGIMAGANISGDLAEPQKAIPLGTLSAIFLTTIVYILTIWTTGSTCVRDADGITAPMLNASADYLFGTYLEPDCVGNGTCKYGLLNYFQVMETESFWGPLITAGIFAATLSSALASLVSAPKIFQAVCKDRLFPYINVFAKGSGKDDEPRRAYLLGFVLSMIMILIGDLNAIAPIISNFFLCSYALINYACFDNSFAKSPGFRPGFRFYNMWISLAGAILCVCVMFIVSWSTALLTFLFFGGLFMYIAHRKPDVNWGSSTQAHSYRSALQGVTRLDNTDEHVKNYRPQVLVLTGNPAARPSLVDFASNITKGTSLMVCGYVVPYAPCDSVFAVIRRLNLQLREWLRKRHIKSFYVSIANPSIRAGAQALIQTTGLGRLRPNIVLLGFKQNWAAKGVQGIADINDYFGIIQDSLDGNIGVMVLRNAGGGLDYTELMREQKLADVTGLRLPDVPAATALKRDESGNPIPGEPANTSESKESEEAHPLDALNNYVMDEDSIDEGSDSDSLTDETSGGGQHPSSGTDYSSVEGSKARLHIANSDVEAGPTTATTGQPNGTGAKPERSNLERLSLIRRRRQKKKAARNTIFGLMSSRRLTTAQRELLSSINRFQRKIKRATIDVWWLYDDGGLTLLIPYLLTMPKSYLENAQLRVFTISTSAKAMELEARNMAALLSKFRINFSDVRVIPDVAKKPQPETVAEFETLIEPFRSLITDESFKDGMISEAELSSQRDKTHRQLRIAELLKQHSMDSDLVVLTLPVPRKGLVSSCLYMAWVDIMTRGLPPTLLVRGNQTSVLTFYS